MEKSSESQTGSSNERTVDETTASAKDSSEERKPHHRWGEIPPKIEVVTVGPIPEENLEILKGLIKKAALRKLGWLQEENAPAQNQTPPSTEVKKPQQHVIHKAIKWEELLENGTFKSRSEIATKEGLTRARVTQIMNLLKLPPHWRDFLEQLDDPGEIRKYSERRLRSYDPDKYPCALCPIKTSLYKEPVDEDTTDPTTYFA